ncbi:MAG: DNA gyrase inhibitor YacG [Chthoniobacteraceae bacterium]
MPPIVRCPTCKKESDFEADPFGPFCSRRCKLIDLGQWFEESHVISDPLTADHFAEYEEKTGEELDRRNSLPQQRGGAEIRKKPKAMQ